MVEEMFSRGTIFILGMRAVVPYLIVSALVVACTTSNSSPSPDSGALELDAGGPELDAGGPLARPVGCPSSGVGNEPGPGQELYEALRVAAGFDSLEVRVVDDPKRDAGAPTIPATISVGTPCSGAKDAAACTSALRALSSTDALVQYVADTAAFHVGLYMVFSKGDATGKLASLADLHTALPSVASPAAAFIVAEANNHRVRCETDWVREEADGYVVLADHGAICFRARELVFVKRDGTVDVRQSIPGRSPCL
jgi:hypothetical protein